MRYGSTIVLLLVFSTSVGTSIWLGKAKSLPDAPNGQKLHVDQVMKDIDGNTYQTIKIGEQWWMAENLKVTRYRNGDAIPHVTDNNAWPNLSTGAYCNYDNDTDNVSTYGRLYNWYAVNDPRGLAPEGWHVPSDAEWETLIDCLGDSAGSKMKGTAYWSSPNTVATNESGFSVLPGGWRSARGYYLWMGYVAYFWSSTEDSSTTAWTRLLGYSGLGVGRYEGYKRHGFSVRCVRY